MEGETEPQRRFGHVTVCMGHYMLLFGGTWREDGQDLQLLPIDVIWMYNLYTEEWKKNIIPTKERAPHARHRTHAEVIESVIYMFGGSKGRFSKDVTNEMWTLTRNSDGSFAWDEIVTTRNTDAPSPRESHTGWEYSGNLWIFGGYGPSPVGYLNECGDFDATTGCNNQLLCFNPLCNEWTNPKCTGSVPSSRCGCASAIWKHKAWLYGGYISWYNGTDELLELNMHSLTWTQIQIHEPKPQALCCCTLTMISDSTLVLHGGAQLLTNGVFHNYKTSSDTWILDLSTQTWRQYISTTDHSRACHKGMTGLNGCVIITGGGKDPRESHDDYTTTFHVMLAAKSLQELAMQSVFKHKNVLPWKFLPQKLQTCLGLTESDLYKCDVRSCDFCN